MRRSDKAIQTVWGAIWGNRGGRGNGVGIRVTRRTQPFRLEMMLACSSQLQWEDIGIDFQQKGFECLMPFFFRATELKDFIVRDVFLDSQVYPLQPGARNMSCFATIARPNNKTYSQQTISQQLPTISNISNQQFGHPVINDKSKTNISGEVQVAPHEPPSHWSCHGPDEGGRLRKHQHNEQWDGREHLGWYAIYTVRTVLWI